MSQLALKPGFEEVFTVLDYYDGPRTGIASFNGRPHFYDCIWDTTRNIYSNRFRLTPISNEVFDLALEDWSIWERWKSAFDAGETTQDSRPSLPKDRQRHDEIHGILAQELKSNEATCVTRIGSFEQVVVPAISSGVIVDTQVQWLEYRD